VLSCDVVWYTENDPEHYISIFGREALNVTKTNEYLKLYEVIRNQTYFTRSGNFYKQKEGLAMGAQSSAFLSEVYLQYIESNYVMDITTKYNILRYFRYVDIILIIYDSQNTDIHSVLNEFNKIQPQLHFTMECETNDTLNYLDLTIHRQSNSFEFSIF
jgi:hypothetical protein